MNVCDFVTQADADTQTVKPVGHWSHTTHTGCCESWHLQDWSMVDEL